MQKKTLLKYYRHRTEHLQILDVRNTLNANRAPEVDHLKSEVTRLRREVKNANNDAKNEIAKLKRDIAFQICQLDLANDEVRVFTCKHDDLTQLYGVANSTREKNAGLVADEMFKEWMGDSRFLAEYAAARQQIISHHAAHERTKPGRGGDSGYIYDQLVHLDGSRGVNFSYKRI